MADVEQTSLDEPIVFTHPSFSYLSPKIVLKRLPYGIGMFATETIAKDELLIGWAGKVVHLKEVLALSDDDRGHILQIDDYLFQIPFWPEYVALSSPLSSSTSQKQACLIGALDSNVASRF